MSQVYLAGYLFQYLTSGVNTWKIGSAELSVMENQHIDRC